MTIQLKLTKEEAILLNQPPMILYCPYKYFTSERRVWWVDKPSTNLKSLTYTICQDCYHNNRMGNTSIEKKDLTPIILENLECNCDGRTDEESFQIQIGKCHIGIYIVDPVFTVPDVKYVVNNEIIDIIVASPFKQCKYVINISSSVEPNLYPFNDKRIITELTADKIDTTNKMWSLENNGKYHFNIDKIAVPGHIYKPLIYSEYKEELNVINDCNIKLYSCQLQQTANKLQGNFINKNIIHDINLHIMNQENYDLVVQENDKDVVDIIL